MWFALSLAVCGGEPVGQVRGSCLLGRLCGLEEDESGPLGRPEEP